MPFKLNPITQKLDLVDVTNAGSIVETLTGNSGGAVGPTGNNINVVGSGTVTVTGNPGTSTLTISDSGSMALVWADEAVSFNAVAGHGYMSTAAVTATLPASPSNGDTIAFVASTSDVFTLQASGSQKITINLTSSSAGGTAASSHSGNTLLLVYQSSSTTWFSTATNGSWNFT